MVFTFCIFNLYFVFCIFHYVFCVLFLYFVFSILYSVFEASTNGLLQSFMETSSVIFYNYMLCSRDDAHNQNMLCATYLFSLAWSICEDEAQTYLFNFHFNAATFQFINFSPLVSHLTTRFYDFSFFVVAS